MLMLNWNRYSYFDSCSQKYFVDWHDSYSCSKWRSEKDLYSVFPCCRHILVMTLWWKGWSVCWLDNTLILTCPVFQGQELYNIFALFQTYPDEESLTKKMVGMLVRQYSICVQQASCSFWCGYSLAIKQPSLGPIIFVQITLQITHHIQQKLSRNLTDSSFWFTIT